jgi:hypothetical protein
MSNEEQNQPLQQPLVMRPLQVKKLTGCGICGSKMVWIRGKYPSEKKRKVCPTCAQERLEQIHDISRKDYGQAYQSNGA